MTHFFPFHHLAAVMYNFFQGRRLAPVDSPHSVRIPFPSQSRCRNQEVMKKSFFKHGWDFPSWALTPRMAARLLFVTTYLLRRESASLSSR